MAGRYASAIWDRIEVAFSPIPGHVEAYRPPQVSGAPQSQAEEKSNEHYRRDPHLFFAGILQVQSSEDDGQQCCCRPKMHSLGKYPLRIASHEKVFEERSNQKK